MKMHKEASTSVRRAEHLCFLVLTKLSHNQQRNISDTIVIYHLVK